MFAGFEVLRLNGLLRSFDSARNQARLDGHALFHAQPLEQIRNPLLGEDAHQVIFKRQVKARGTRVALAAGTAT